MVPCEQRETPLPRRRRLLLGAAVLAVLVAGGAAISGTWDPLPRVPGASTTSAEDTFVTQDGCDPSTKVADRRRFLPAPETLRLRRTVEGHVLGYCAPDEPAMRLGRRLVRFATGEADAPAFAAQVRRWIDGRRLAPLSADRAAQRSSWGDTSAVGELRRLADRARDGTPVGRASGAAPRRRIISDPNGGLTYVEPSAGPYVSVLDGADAAPGALSRVSGVRCRAQGYPAPLARRSSAVLVIGVSTAPSEPDCDFVDVFTDDDGRIDALVLRTGDGGPPSKPRKAGSGRT